MNIAPRNRVSGHRRVRHGGTRRTLHLHTFATLSLFAAACSSNPASGTGLPIETRDAESRSSDANVDARTDDASGQSVRGDASGDGAREAFPPFDAGPPACAEAGTCPPGVWENVTPSGVSLDPNFACEACNYGAMDIVVDPVRPSDMYGFVCYQGVWKSTDYGGTWTKVSTGTNSSHIESGRPWTAAIDPNLGRDPSTPPTLWTVDGYGDTPGGVFKSTDGGVNWSLAIVNGVDLYSLDVDPYDSNHLVAGVHEATGVYESTDGGTTWTQVTTPANIGISLYVFFIDTGSSSTTRETWLSQAQWGSNVNGIWRTTNAGAAWTQVEAALEHPHGSTQIFQDGLGHVYAAGIGLGGTGGLWRSADYGGTWSSTDSGGFIQSAVFGTPTTIYATAAGATQDPTGINLHNQKSMRSDGVNWTDWTPIAPTGMGNGAKRASVTFDGTHSIIVSGNFLAGIWRYVEP